MKSLIPTVSLCLTATLTGQQPVSLRPTADATVRSDQPATNFGSATELGLAKHKNAAGSIYFMRSYLRFDLSGLKGRALASKAELRFYEQRTIAAGGLEVAAYPVAATWSEGSVTWNNKPGNAAGVLSKVKVGDSFNRGWKAFDITSLVRSWQLGAANHGVVLRLERESSAGAYRPGWGPSRESTSSNLRPYLYVETVAVSGFGRGCGPVATWPRLGVSTGAPKVGTTMILSGSLLAPGKPALLAVGLSRTTYAGAKLPIMLDPTVGPPCQLLVSLDVILSFTANAQGIVTVPVPIPNLGGLAGSEAFLQMASPGSAAHMTHGLALRFY